MSLWELAAAVDGWNKANVEEASPDPPSSADYDAMLDRHAEWMATVH